MVFQCKSNTTWTLFSRSHTSWTCNRIDFYQAELASSNVFKEKTWEERARKYPLLISHFISVFRLYLMWRVNDKKHWLSHFNVQISVIPFLLFTAKGQYLLRLNISFHRLDIFRGFSGSLKFAQNRNLWISQAFHFSNTCVDTKVVFLTEKVPTDFNFEKHL